MGREVKGRYTRRMKAVRLVVVKLQRDEAASFCWKMSNRTVTGSQTMELYDLWNSGPLRSSWARK